MAGKNNKNQNMPGSAPNKSGNYMEEYGSDMNPAKKGNAVNPYGAGKTSTTTRTNNP